MKKKIVLLQKTRLACLTYAWRMQSMDFSHIPNMLEANKQVSKKNSDIIAKWTEQIFFELEHFPCTILFFQLPAYDGDFSFFFFFWPDYM